jgi:hypothetical protein
VYTTNGDVVTARSETLDRGQMLKHEKQAESPVFSPPITEQLIGTATDAQLAAALDFLKSRNGAKQEPDR